MMPALSTRSNLNVGFPLHKLSLESLVTNKPVYLCRKPNIAYIYYYIKLMSINYLLHCNVQWPKKFFIPRVPDDLYQSIVLRI